MFQLTEVHELAGSETIPDALPTKCFGNYSLKGDPQNDPSNSEPTVRGRIMVM